MHTRLHILTITACLLAVGCSSPPPRLIVKTERVPCPPYKLEVQCPITPVPLIGETWNDFAGRVDAWSKICQAALWAWEESYLDCSGRPDEE